MATSTKVQFKLDTLQEQALTAIDEQIAEAEAAVSSYQDNSDVDRARKQWRVKQEERFIEFTRNLADTDDETLAQFRVEPMPTVDHHERVRTARHLAALKARRTQILAKAGSLVPDADGNLALTKTQLSEFFGL